MMNEVLKVLIVEDSLIDAELILYKLSEAGYQVEHGFVDNAFDMRRLLSEKKWDIVLCDYSMPSFNPYEALNIIREFNSDIPLIVISGTIGEENAINLIKSGCHDCIMKNNMTRLPGVIRWEINEARTRKENRTFKERLEKYQLLAEKANDAMFFTDKEGNILEVNDAATKIYGFSYKEFLTMKIFDLSSTDEKKLSLEQIGVADQDQEGIVFETVHYRKDNTTIYVEVSSQGILLVGRWVLLSIVRDITERKLAEDALRASEKKFRTLVDNAPDVIARFDSAFRFVYINSRAEKELGIPPEYFLGKTDRELGMPENVVQKTEEALQWVFQNKIEKSIEIPFNTPNGMKYYYTIIVPEFSEDGSVSTVLSITRSITEIRQAEESLKLSLQRYKNLLDGTVTALSSAMEIRDPYTSGHQRRVSKLATAIADKLDMDSDTVEAIRITGLLHDIGKMYIPAEILTKPVKLTPLEYSMIKVHAEAGYNILKSIDFTRPIAEVVYQHHEKLDGSGYPRQLKGEQILKEARIICVADVVEAMVSHRPYRPAMSLDDALAEIELGEGTKYDADCVKSCVKLFRDEGYEI